MFQYWTFVISILTAFFVAVQSRNIVLKFSTNVQYENYRRSS